MRLRFIILVLLALLITAGFVGAVSAETTISSISITTDVPNPVTGEKPVQKVNCSDKNATTENVNWEGELNNGNFTSGVKYTAKITIKANNGYNFSSSISSIPVAGSGSWSAKLENNNKTIIATKEFDETVKIPISSITVSGITAPVAGHKPNTTNPVVIGKGVNNNTITQFTWKTSSDSKVSGNFTYSMVYKAMFTVNALNEYEFTSETDISVSGGGTGSITTVSGESGTVTIIYPATERDPSIKTPITNLAISDIDVPITGATPDKSAAISSSPEDSVEMNPEVTWNCTSTFDNNTQYKVTVTAKASPGNIFTSSTIATINGQTATKSNQTNDTFVFTYTFPPTRYAISTVYLTLTAPVAGNTPATKVASNTSNVNAASSSVTWNPDDDKFEAGKEYTATIKVPAVSGYQYLSDPTVYLNGEKISSVNIDSDGKLKVEYDFTNKISKVYLTITEPSTGISSESSTKSAKTSDEFATIKSVSWSPNHALFAQGTTYTVTINVALDTSLEYADTISFYINNIVASASKKSDGTYDVSYTFTTANEISRISITLNAPVTGGSAQKTARIESNPYNAVEGSVSWSPYDSIFAADTAYTANINVNTYSGYKFASSVTATVNGNAATVKRTSDSSVVVSYAYPRTAKAVTADIGQDNLKQVSNEETVETNTTSFVPNPIGIIQELVKLFMALFNFDNYLMFQNNTTVTSP